MRRECGAGGRSSVDEWPTVERLVLQYFEDRGLRDPKIVHVFDTPGGGCIVCAEGFGDGGYAQRDWLEVV